SMNARGAQVSVPTKLDTTRAEDEQRHGVAFLRAGRTAASLGDPRPHIHDPLRMLRTERALLVRASGVITYAPRPSPKTVSWGAGQLPGATSGDQTPRALRSSRVVRSPRVRNARQRGTAAPGGVLDGDARRGARLRDRAGCRCAHRAC